MFILRRDIIAYACIAAFALAGGTAIHLNAVSGLDAARARYRAESHAASMAAASNAQAQFDSIYQNLRTISRLPSVKKTDRYATNINQDGIATIQELYNNLASNVDVSEVYIVGKDLNSDEIDPVTQAPQTPILMFDDLIGNDVGGGANVVRQFEAEIYEYHLLHRQMLYYEAHNPTIATTDGFNIPMISGAQVVTCDNTVYNVTLKDSDRTGMIFSVPFFGPDGSFKGTISAIIRVKAIRAVLPGQYFALVNRSYSALLVSKSGLPGPQALNAAALAQPDPGLIYSEVIPLSVHDPRSTWEVWAGLPNSAFYTRADVLGVHGFARSAYAVLTLLVLIALAVVMLIGRNAANLARAATALDALAHGDEQATLTGRERGGALGDLARAFEKFRAALAEKQQLELLAAAERETAEMERQKYDEERAASLAAQRQVVSVLAKALISFANGDLTWKITEWFSAEYKGLRMDFNQASSRMEATMRRVMTSTRAVEAGAAEIREATADLARRTEHQAGQLEQAAASLDEVTGAVRKTSQNAATAAELAAAASTGATASASVVRNTVEAMNGIESSSHRIANIIGVIDEIAFQTNLLALNAGVEAARAGDAGRGFAVVATEVRALAARSADAAKEIKTIIAASGKQVGNGVKLVNETGETLLRITGQITQLTDLVRDIASSAQAQAGALNNVNAAVSQMDQTTQQNAAMVEEAAAASANLNTEASALSHLVDEFKMSDTPTEELEAAANRGFGPPKIAARVPALV